MKENILILTKIKDGNIKREYKEYRNIYTFFACVNADLCRFKKSNMDYMSITVESGKRSVNAVFERVKSYDIGKRAKYYLYVEGKQYNMRTIKKALLEILECFRNFVICDEKKLNENPVIL